MHSSPSTLRFIITHIVRSVGLYDYLRDMKRDYRFRLHSRLTMIQWHADGCPMPPPDAVKYKILHEIGRRFNLYTFVETGTWFGNSLFALRNKFKEMHSIEIAPQLYEHSRQSLAHLNHIHLHCGDSAEVLPRVLSQLKYPTLFWLDGHYCEGPSLRGDKDTPIERELDLLLSRPSGKNVVLIDDARLFNGENDYPSIEKLKQVISIARPTSVFEVKNDIIYIYPV